MELNHHKHCNQYVQAQPSRFPECDNATDTQINRFIQAEDGFQANTGSNSRKSIQTELQVSTLSQSETQSEVSIEGQPARIQTVRLPPLTLGEISFARYLRYHEMQAYLQRLTTDYPELVTIEHYGTSYENRDLTLIHISSGGACKKPLIFIDAGIHAREWIAPAQALYIINQLVESPKNRYLIKNIDWAVIPVVNPDGYEYSHIVDRFWRKTRSRGKEFDGVDANRNFAYHWGGPGSSHKECSNVYAGPTPFSEPETIALSKAIAKYSNRAKLYLTFHSGKKCILYPWDSTCDIPYNTVQLQTLALRVAKAIYNIKRTKYGVSPVRTFAAESGSSRDWAYAVEGIKLAYTIGLPAYGDTKFEIPPDMILSIVAEMFEGIRIFHEFAEGEL